MLRKWEDLPAFMKYPEVRSYYDILVKRQLSLRMKRAFDVMAAAVLLVVLAIPMLIIAICIVRDSSGGVFYRQERVTAYGKRFRIHKFRTMVAEAEKRGSRITVRNDTRITKMGAFLRKYRLDELPQLLDVLSGNMSFVGARPELVRYVRAYTKEMRATLLLPAGITSEASIRYKNEAELLDETEDIDKRYIEKILSEKMQYNLESIRRFSCIREMVTMMRTVLAVFGKEY